MAASPSDSVKPQAKQASTHENHCHWFGHVHWATIPRIATSAVSHSPYVFVGILVKRIVPAADEM
jgi:hypothetical protein